MKISKIVATLLVSTQILTAVSTQVLAAPYASAPTTSGETITRAEKSVSGDYTITIKPRLTDGAGEEIKAKGGTYIIEQIATISASGEEIPTKGAKQTIYLADDSDKVVEVPEDGLYKITPGKRIPGYKVDLGYKDPKSGETKGYYQYGFPVHSSKDTIAADGTEDNFMYSSKNQSITMIPKIETFVGTIKFDKLAEDGKALAGVKFKATKIYDAKTAKYEDEVIGTVESQEDGTVTFDNLSEGVYKVEETETVSGYELNKNPMYYVVTLDEDRDSETFNQPVVNILTESEAKDTIQAYVKAYEEDLAASKQEVTPTTVTDLAKAYTDLTGKYNETKGLKADLWDFVNYRTPLVDKNVSALHQHAEYKSTLQENGDKLVPLSDIDTPVTFTFTADVPTDVAKYKTYKLTDTLDEAFDISTLDTSAVEVTINGKALSTDDYDITLKGRTLEITFNEAQRKALGANEAVAAGTQNELGVKFNIEFDSRHASVVNDALIPNKVTLTYQNETGEESELESEVEVQPKEGILEVTKVDNKKEVLPGAKFKLWYQLTQEELDAGAKGESVGRVLKKVDNLVSATNSHKEDVNVIGNDGVKGTEDDNVLVSDKDGKIYIDDLPFGTYYLQEIEAPQGYRLNENLIKIEIKDLDSESQFNITYEQAPTGDTYKDYKVTAGSQVEMVNYKESEWFPATGTMGIIAYAGAAGALVLTVVGLGKLKKDESEESAQIN